MATVISLREVIETMEMQGKNCLCYLDPETGAIVTATEEVRRLAEEPEESLDNLPKWQREMCGSSAPCWRAAAACSCLTASGVVYYE